VLISFEDWSTGILLKHGLPLRRPLGHQKPGSGSGSRSGQHSDPQWPKMLNPDPHWKPMRIRKTDKKGQANI
jgi:hypothetical protein